MPTISPGDVAGVATVFALDPGATPLDDDLGGWAVWYAVHGWHIFPLHVGQKNPATRHGCLDASNDLRDISNWWGTAEYNIGLVPPDDVFVIDIDPRSGGDASWDRLRLDLKLAERPTLETISGRGDGGRHLFYRRVNDLKLTGRRLQGTGIDLKQSTGYLVAPPSIHPDSGKAYRRVERAIAQAPDRLWEYLAEDPAAVQAIKRERAQVAPGTIEGPADWYTENMRWNDVLEPAGWTRVYMDGDEDGSMWAHPAATSPVSATIKHGLLFVYSPNTPFDTTEPGNPKGYTRFAAFALLEHGGNMSEAAHAVFKLIPR